MYYTINDLSSYRNQLILLTQSSCTYKHLLLTCIHLEDYITTIRYGYIVIVGQKETVEIDIVKE